MSWWRRLFGVSDAEPEPPADPPPPPDSPAPPDTPPVVEPTHEPEAPTIPALVSALPDWLLPHRRPTWRPRVDDGEGAPDGSRFGGRAWLPAGTDWPTCPSCGHSLRLLAQLDASTLPTDAPGHGEGLIQVFYCLTEEPAICEVALSGWEAFSGASHVRRVPRGDGALGQPTGFDPLPAQAIVGWTEHDDAPNVEEGALELSEEAEEEYQEGEFPRAGDKLGGWPFWVQGIEYPTCRQCGTTMHLLLQLDSEDHVPTMWGDSGCAHITQCASHPDELALAWACY
ncbi:MAG: hypothetical protein ACI9K2_001016 [Myxococcota bacterium]|jgi:hypothetical protein